MRSAVLRNEIRKNRIQLQELNRPHTTHVSCVEDKLSALMHLPRAHMIIASPRPTKPPTAQVPSHRPQRSSPQRPRVGQVPLAVQPHSPQYYCILLVHDDER